MQFSTTTSTPLVSIVTPSFNQADYLEEAILSVLEQDYPNIEHIIVDGRSSDHTVDILRKYGGQIKWVSEPDNGQAEALNKGFKMATGTIIGWLNADDLYTESAVSTAIKTVNRYPDAFLFHGNGEYVDSIGRVTKRTGQNDTLEDILCINTIMSTSSFWRREVFERVGYLNEELHYVLDWEYWVRIGLDGMGIQHISGNALSRSREHSDAKTMLVKDKFYQERFRILDSIFNSPATPESIRSLRQRAYGGVYASGAYFYFRNGYLVKSFRSFVMALRSYPRIFLDFRKYFTFDNLVPLLRSFFDRSKMLST